MPLAAFYLHSLGSAALALHCCALRGTSDGATMFAPGGAGTTPRTVFDNSFVLVAPASIIGSELPRARLRPFALPRAYRAPVFPLPCLVGEPVRGGGEG